MVGSEKRTQIRRAAAKKFRERGFHAVSVREIAEAVGIQGGSLYSHVQGKEDVLWDIVAHAAERFFAKLNPIVESDRETERKLRDMIVAHVEVVTSDLDAASVYSTEWRHLSDDRLKECAELRDRYESIFRDMTERGIREGLLAPSDSAFAARFILSSLNWVYQWFDPHGKLTAEEVGRKLAEFILDGLRRRTT